MAYTNIISEMHLLEFGEDEVNGFESSLDKSKESPKNNDSNHYVNYDAVNSSSIKSFSKDDHDNNSKTNTSNINGDCKQFGVPLLILKKTTSSSSSTGPSVKAPTVSSNEINLRTKSSPNSRGPKDNNLRLNSSGNKEKVNNNASSPNSINSDRYKGKQEEEIMDSIDFLSSIKDYLTTDRVAIVVEKIRAALDQEKAELNLKINQLERSMEMDCEVIVTTRSSNRSNKSTPRVEGFNTRSKSLQSYDTKSDYKSDLYYGDSKASDTGRGSDRDSEIGSVSNRSNGDRFDICVVCGVDVDTSDSVTARSKDSGTARSKGSCEWNDYIDVDNRTSSSSRNKPDDINNNSTNSLLTLELEILCYDCKGRNRREKILGGRLPKVEPSSISRASSYMDDKKERNEFEYEQEGPSLSPGGRGTGKENDNHTRKQPSSKFRNRLQAARDEHHFMADDYLS